MLDLVQDLTHTTFVETDSTHAQDRNPDESSDPK
jgi:hypothetical protein